MKGTFNYMKATIVIPFYNNDSTLENTIKSVLNQTYQDWILILINDGSTDASVSIAKKYLSDKVSLIDDGLNKGLIYRLNQAIDMTKTPYFVRMDSDDIMMPDRLQKQISYLESHTDVDLVGSSAYIIDETNRILSLRKASNNRASIVEIIKGGLFIHPTVTGRTEWFKNNKYHAEFNRAEDLELWCRTFGETQYYNFEEPLLFYRDPMNLNIKKYEATSITLKKIIRKYVTGFERVKLLLREIFKIQIYKILSTLNMTSLINKKRNSQIDTKNLAEAKEKLLNAIK